MKRSALAAAIVTLAAAVFLLLPGQSSPAQQAANGWSAIKGQVVFAGAALPPVQEIKVDPNHRDHVFCLAKGPILSEELVINPKNKGVKWVFVWLTPEKAAPPLPVHPSLQQIKIPAVEIDQPCCKFEPHAVALRQGQDLIAKNSAAVAHNVHWTGHPLKNPGGNVIVPAAQSYTIKGLNTDQYPIEVKCDIHGWMKAYVRVFDHPYFALTDQDGKFEIKLAPAGQYRLRMWSDLGYGPGGRDGSPITINPGVDSDLGKIEMKPAS